MFLKGILLSALSKKGIGFLSIKCETVAVTKGGALLMGMSAFLAYPRLAFKKHVLPLFISYFCCKFL